MKKLLRIGVLSLFLVLGVATAEAQSVLQAVPDNFYFSSRNQRLNILANDLPGDCGTNLNNIQIGLVTPPQHGTVTISTANVVQYRADAGFYGQDKFTYKITCGGTVSQADVYLNVSDKPDFIDDAECIVDAKPAIFDIKKVAESTDYIQTYAIPYVADLDGDGSPEIVALNWHTNYNGTPATQNYLRYSNGIKIFKYNTNAITGAKTVDLVETIMTSTIPSYVVQPLAIADVDGDGIAEIIVGMGNGKLLPTDPAPAHNSFKLRAYRMGEGGAILWESTVPYFSTAPVHDMSASIAIHDIDGDGLVEIFIGDRIFAGESGKLLATLPAGGLGRRPFASSGTTDGFIPAVGDVDGDGIMEIVGGNTTYKVTINDRDNPALNTVSILAQVPLVDGYTSLADIDGDGILDVVVVGASDGRTNVLTGLPTTGAPTQMYVWQGGTSAMIGAPINTNSASGSRPFIGDIDGDGKPDIAFTTYCKFDAYRFTGTALQKMFPTVVTTDTSGATTMSMFDFDNDGEVELVYRDETDIRIMGVTRNGAGQVNGTYDKAKYTCYSGTHTEYPVVVDLDGDGHAEIVVAGSINPTNVSSVITNRTQQVMIFGSATNSWFPARSVWNQHGYNPTTINEDLTVPPRPLSPSTQIIRHDGTVHKPFNSYLQQAGILNTEGDPLHKVPDLAFQTGKTQRMHYDVGTDKLTITCYISNVGSLDFRNGSIKLALYSYDGVTTAYDLVGSTVHTAQTLVVGGNTVLTLEISGYSSIIPTLPAQNTWYVAINLDDKGTNAPADYYLAQEECNAWNNMTNSLSYVSANRIMCEGETSVVTLDPAGVYTCRWYTSAGTPFPSLAAQTGDSQTITKVGDQDEFYLVRVFQGTKEMTIAPDTVHIYHTADSLVWTGKESADWHDVRNWFNPADLTNEEIYRNIPRPCTNVLIPTRDQDGSRIAYYPNLRTSTTDYTLYKDSASCNNISFEHGGEVEFSGLLSYQKAYVQLTLMSNRWYCFAPPLRDFNTGDIFLNNKNPYLDDSFTFVHLFSQTDPEWYSYIEGDWGKTFNSPYYKAPIGQGYGVWIDDLDPNASNHKEMDYSFPKTDSEYWIYSPDGNPSAGPYPTNKKFPHRLIYEETLNGATNDVLLHVASTSIGKDIIVGNPFMAHLNFDLFYAANSHLIENHYRLMDADGNYATYTMGGVSTGNPILTKNVAPMQAILVTPRANINPSIVANSLKANMNMTFTNTDPDAKIRSAAETAVSPSNDFMWASLATAQGSNRSALVHDPNVTATTMYNPNTDMYKFLRKGLEGSNIYFLTEEGLYMDIKTVSSLENLNLRIGINSKKTGSMALAFERLWAFADGYDVYLEDKYEKKTMNMREDAIYSFTKNTTAELMDDRFALRVTKVGTSIDEIVNTVSRLHYFSDNGLLTIRTTEGVLDNALVYDLQGRLIANRQRIANSEVSFTLNKGIYIVKVASEGRQETMKVIVQ